MAALIPLLPRAGLDVADLAHNKRLVGQAAPAADVCCCQSVDRSQSFLEVVVVVPVGHPDTTDAAV